MRRNPVISLGLAIVYYGTMAIGTIVLGGAAAVVVHDAVKGKKEEEEQKQLDELGEKGRRMAGWAVLSTMAFVLGRSMMRSAWQPSRTGGV